MEENKINPPRWAERVLEWYCKPEILEDLQGDLNEYFDRNIKSKGPRRAKLIYIIDVLKFFRLYTIRKPKFVNLLINWLMLGSYIKTSGRNMVRNKLFSTINIAGLAVSMSVGLIVISLISDMYSFDQFHENHSRIYRVTSRYSSVSEKESKLATTSLKAAKEIQENFSVPEAIAVFHSGFDGDVKAGEKAIPLKGYWANESLHKVFSFPFLKGNPATALKAPFSIILTETAAQKLFGNEEALNKVLELHGKQYTVTGVIKDVPKFSHVRFEMLGSLSTSEILNKDDKDELAWDNVWITWVYLLLPPNADLITLKANLDQLSAKEDSKVKNTHIELSLQSLDDILLGEDMGNQIGPVVGGRAIWIFGGLAFVVILSACFNYTNLSIARALRRTREVGIRKVIGALKTHVMSQFIIEAVLISVCSLFMALLLFFLIRPYFLSLEEEFHENLSLELSPIMIVYFILFALVIGIVAGFFPALFFSKINAIQVLKNISSGAGLKKLTMRKVLVVFQYCISIIFITTSILIYKQYKHFVAFDLGFKTENILNIELQHNKPDILMKELNELQEVKGISRSLMVTSVGNYWGSNMKYQSNPDDSTIVYYNTVDENYLTLHEHKLLAGRNFNPKSDSAVESEVIVNQQVLKRFNIAHQNPAEAINEIVKVDGKALRIIGVMKDFQYGIANNRNNTKEVMLRYSSSKANFLNVKIASTDIVATYGKIDAIWRKVDQVHPLTAKFYKEQIENSFSGLKASIKMVGFLAFLAVCIAMMGLLGMVVFTTETRLKEISVRKVLGASEAGLLFLLTKGFLLLLIIAVAVGLPITYLFFDQVLFQQMSNHAPILISDFLMGSVAIILIALIMIVMQTLKVTRTNPAEVLKTE